MKKILIGGFLSLCGAIMDAAIIIAAGTYASSLKSWSGSKFWYAVFGAPVYGNEADLSLHLGFLFVLGLLFIGIGAIFFIVELVKEQKSK